MSKQIPKDTVWISAELNGSCYEEEKQKCLDCVNCDIDGSCIAKREAPFGDFVCEHNEQFEPLDTGEIDK